MSGAVGLGAGVEQRVGVVGPRGGVQHHRDVVVGGGVQPVEHQALVVGLPDLHVEAQPAAPRLAPVGHSVCVVVP